MRLLYDINVLLDAIMEREPFATSAAAVIDLAYGRQIRGLICADSFSTLMYILTHRSSLLRSEALSVLRDLRGIFDVAEVSTSVIDRALASDWPDFEDAIVYQSAVSARADGIVTRDANGFTAGALRVLTPDQLLAITPRN